MSSFRICVTIVDTPEELSLCVDEALYNESGNDPASAVEEEEESEFLYGYFDKSLFEEPVIVIEEEEEPPKQKTTRIIQSHINDMEEILSCLRDYVAEDDIVQVEMNDFNQIRFIVDMSSEECVLLNLASAASSMTICDVADTSHEGE